jgi:multisubunit Na+/H+ antiporter MnhG subunit
MTDVNTKRDMFNSYREDLLKRNLSNTENYDKAILTLSSASLGLSLALVKIIVPADEAEFFWMLYSNWALLVLSIFSSLSAYLISNKALEKELSKARSYYIDNDESAFDIKNGYIKFNKASNYFTGIAFSLSIILIVLFVALNMETIKMSDKDNQIKTMIENDPRTIKKSADIPTMERAPTQAPSPAPAPQKQDSNDS